MPTAEEMLVSNDDQDFYGKHYFEQMAAEHGTPPLQSRARADLSERCVYWLRSFMRYKLPPARILELGSSHGGFVATLRWAGFDAMGLDLSPWLVRYASETFGVPMLEGPVEDQEIAPESLDAIVLMDVLEHLREPRVTLRHCLKLLKPDGIFYLQTPIYTEGSSFESLQSANAPFMAMLLPDQHLHLFSRSSVQALFQSLDVPCVSFEPAIFSQYDMCLAASRAPLKQVLEDDIVRCLLSSPQSRMSLALLDLELKFRELGQIYGESETDRAARLDQIRSLRQQLNFSEGDSQSRYAQIETLNKLLQESEADRSARLDQIHSLGERLAILQEDSQSRYEQIEKLNKLLQESEADRSARLEHLQGLGEQLAILQEDSQLRYKQIETLNKLLQESEAGRRAGLDQIHSLDEQLATSQRDSHSRYEQINEQLRQKSARLREISAHYNAQVKMLRRIEQTFLFRGAQKFGFWRWWRRHT